MELRGTSKPPQKPKKFSPAQPLTVEAAVRIRKQAKKLMGAAMLLGVMLFPIHADAKRVPYRVTVGSSATPVIPNGDVNCQWITFQNNASHAMSIGNATTVVGQQIQLVVGASFYLGRAYSATYNLAGWYVAGTAGDVLDVVCEDGQ